MKGAVSSALSLRLSWSDPGSATGRAMNTSKLLKLHTPRQVSEARTKLREHLDAVLALMEGRPANFQERSMAGLQEGAGPMIKIDAAALNAAVKHAITELGIVQNTLGKE